MINKKYTYYELSFDSGLDISPSIDEVTITYKLGYNNIYTIKGIIKYSLFVVALILFIPVLIPVSIILWGFGGFLQTITLPFSYSGLILVELQYLIDNFKNKG